jgi:serine/threonine-protein kinase PpkA
MANRQQGKCNNFGNCTKADTGELINITSADLNPLCPECELPLVIKQPKKIFTPPIIITLIALLILGFSTLVVSEYSNRQHNNNDKPIISVCSPLLMEGKKSLFQRILIKPNSHKSIEFGGMADQSIIPFSRYYVYARQTNNNEEWLNIGSSIHCKKEGWVKAKETLEWKQQLSLTFTNTATKDRGNAYFFKDKEALQDVVKNSATIQENDSRLVAVEPENYVDPETSFYLTPILDFTTQSDINLLKVATATLNPNVPSTPDLTPKELAIVFVIDTTISMKPYIEEVKKVVGKVYDRFQKSPFRNQVKFGLVAFRSNIKFRPELEYVTKLFVDPGLPQEEQDFINIVNRIDEASISSLKFDEDSYAGVSAAIYQIKWEKFLGRNLVLITDAGAIEPDEKLKDGSQFSGVDDLNAETIRDIAQKTKGINIYSLHLKTPKGKEYKDHEKAARQYNFLTRNSITNSSLYYGQEIKEGQTDFFGDSLDCMVQSWTAMMISLNNNQGQEKKLIADYCPNTNLETVNPDYARQKEKMRDDQLLLGHALRLKYLGAKEGTQVPDVVEGWINDRTTETSPMKVQVNVLLSRSELNTLAEKIKAIIESDTASQSDVSSQATQFFKNLKQRASSIVRDPKLLNDSTVGEMLNLEELLDLPYKSQIMGITELDWASWSFSQRESLLSTLRSKLKAYNTIEESNSAWHKLAEETDENDKVALIPLDLLP